MYDFGDNKRGKGFLELILCYLFLKKSFSKRNYIEFERGLESTRIYTERSSVPGCQIISLKRRKVQCKAVEPQERNLGPIKRNGHSSIENPQWLSPPAAAPQCSPQQLPVLPCVPAPTASHNPTQGLNLTLHFNPFKHPFVPFFPITFSKTSRLWKEARGSSVRINFFKRQELKVEKEA